MRRGNKRAALRVLAANCNQLGFPPLVRLRRRELLLELEQGGPVLRVPLAALRVDRPGD